MVADELLAGFFLAGQPGVEAIFLIYEGKYFWWWQKGTMLAGGCDCRCLRKKMLEFCFSSGTSLRSSKSVNVGTDQKLGTLSPIPTKIASQVAILLEPLVSEE